MFLILEKAEVPERDNRNRGITPLLGGHVYQQHMAVLRLLDLLDFQHPVSGVRLENPKRLESKDLFDDVEVSLNDGSLHRFQVKWGFQQSYDDNLVAWRLADFKNPSGNLYAVDLFNTWQGYQDSGVYPYCHIYTSKPSDESLQPFLISCQDEIPFEGVYFRFDISLYDQLREADRSNIDKERFEQFLAHLYLSFDQPGLAIENEPIGHHGGMKNQILARIDELGLPDSAYVRNQRLDANTLYDKLCKIASNANLSRNQIDLKSLQQRLDLDPTRGSIEQPAQVDENVFVERESDLAQFEQAITDCEGGLICLVGKPGSGKSWLLEHWHSTQTSIPIFYCFRGLDDELLGRRALEDQAVKNLLHDYDRFFENVIGSRPYANTVEELQERLNILSSKLDNGNKQIIVIDGLDHAVRTSAQLASRDATIVQLLEKLSIPSGIILIVGTQPGEHLDGLSSGTAVVELSGFSVEETIDYLKNKLDLELSDDQCNRLHDVSDGLPLILRFVANEIAMLRDSQSGVDALIDGLPSTGGEIDLYYDYLWQSLPGYQRYGTEGAAHKVLKTLAIRKPGFVLTEQRLRNIIPRAVVSASDYSAALRQVTPVVDIDLHSRGEYALFANSLQIYLVRKMEEGSDYQEFLKHAYDYCTTNFSTAPAHRFRWQYAYDLNLHSEILSVVNLEYVDDATVSLFPREDIRRNIGIAVKSADKTDQIVDLARLGLLNFYTRRRFENIDERDLIRNLVYHGDGHQVQHQLLYGGDLIFSEQETIHLLLDSLELNVSLDYDSLFVKLSEKIADLDDEGRKNIDPVEYWGLAISCGHGTSYYHEIFLKVIEGKSQEIKDNYYSGFIDALAEYASSDQIKEFSTFAGFASYTSSISEALITALQREGAVEEAKVAWESHLDQYGSTATGFLYLGCLLGADKARICNLLDHTKSIIDPPDQYHVSDEYLAEMGEMFSTICLLAYVDDGEKLNISQQAIGQFPRSYIKEFLDVGFHIRKNEGRSLAGDTVDLDPSIIRRLVDYEQRGDERPRVVDISTSTGMANALCDLLNTTAVIVHESQLSGFANAIAHIFANRLGYAIGGYSYKFPSTHRLLRAISGIANQYRETDFVSQFQGIVQDIQNDVVSREGYEGARTSALLEVSNLWAVLGDVAKADKVFQTALRDSHSYGQRKDVTFLQAIRSLGHENEIDAAGVISRIKELMDLALHLGWMTDWSEVRAVMPELCEELARRKLASAFVLLEIFRRKGYRHYYDNCLRSCIANADSDYQLFYALSDTIIEVRNMYDELVRLFGIKTGLIIKTANSGQVITARELALDLRLFLLRDVAQSERGKLVRMFNQMAAKVGVDLIDDIEEEPSGNDRDRPETLSFGGRQVAFVDFLAEVDAADVSRLQEICDSIDRDLGSYYATRELWRRVIELSKVVNQQQLSQLTNIVRERVNNGEASEVLWAIAVAYRRFGDSANYIAFARKACESERGWGGVFSEDNEARLATLAQDDHQWVESFLREHLYRSAVSGLYIDTAYAIPTFQAIDIATGNRDRAHQLWVTFHDLLISLFRHAPDRESPFEDLLRDPGQPVKESTIEALLTRLESDEFAVKHRTAETLAHIVASQTEFINSIVNRLASTNHHTARILLAAWLEFILDQQLDALQSYRTQLEHMVVNELSFYIRKQLEGIVQVVGRIPDRLIRVNSAIIELSGPSGDFTNKLFNHCMSHTRTLISACAQALNRSSRQLAALVELECQRMGVNLESIGLQLRDQLYEYRSPQGDTVPFEAVTDYYVKYALNRVICNILDADAGVDQQGFFSGMREHDPMFWKIHRTPKPAHISPIPANDDLDEWIADGCDRRETTVVDDIETDVILAEMESIESERVKYNRQMGAVLVARQNSVDLFDLNSLGGFLINPGVNFRTINALKQDYSDTMLLVEGTPCFCYQPGFWWLQGSYEYLRLNPRISSGLNLTWASKGPFDMEIDGSRAVTYQAWRNGFMPDEYSRLEEHSGCYATVAPDLIRAIIERYDMNILIVQHEIRTRKEEHWREGRATESRETYSLKLVGHTYGIR